MKTQIVVVGSGAGGLELVRRLGARLGRKDFDIILVERRRALQYSGKIRWGRDLSVRS